MSRGDYQGFGAPTTAAPHHIFVRIPSDRNGQVEIWEDFGAAGVGSSVARICRVILPRPVWRAIADPVRTYLNRRLRDHKVPTSKFVLGADNRIDRILGREIAVLAWAVADMTPEEAEAATVRWAAYRPEELWWLFIQADVDGGEWDDPADGWRLALRHAFAAPVTPSKKRRSRYPLRNNNLELPFSEI